MSDNGYSPTLDITVSKNYLRVRNGPVDIVVVDHPDDKPWTEICVEIAEVGFYTNQCHLVSVLSKHIHPLSSNIEERGGLYEWEDTLLALQDWRNTYERMRFGLARAVGFMLGNEYVKGFAPRPQQLQEIHAAIKESNK